jgi:hypothetical protein
VPPSQPPNEMVASRASVWQVLRYVLFRYMKWSGVTPHYCELSQFINLKLILDGVLDLTFREDHVVVQGLNPMVSAVMINSNGRNPCAHHAGGY